MRSTEKIENGWKVLSEIVGCDIRRKFSAYGWYEDADFTISKEDHWHGWWNECYDLVSVWAKTESGRGKMKEMKPRFEELGWNVNDRLINGGMSFSFSEMTREESDKKAYENLIHGGRMSD